jgi:hypothetical protein
MGPVRQFKMLDTILCGLFNNSIKIPLCHKSEGRGFETR